MQYAPKSQSAAANIFLQLCVWLCLLFSVFCCSIAFRWHVQLCIQCVAAIPQFNAAIRFPSNINYCFIILFFHLWPIQQTYQCELRSTHKCRPQYARCRLWRRQQIDVQICMYKPRTSHPVLGARLYWYIFNANFVAYNCPFDDCFPIVYPIVSARIFLCTLLLYLLKWCTHYLIPYANSRLPLVFAVIATNLFFFCIESKRVHISTDSFGSYVCHNYGFSFGWYLIWLIEFRRRFMHFACMCTCNWPYLHAITAIIK